MNSIQELIDFAESIPEDQWITNRFCEDVVNRNTKQKACFIGHLNFHLTGDYLANILLGYPAPTSKIGQILKVNGLEGRELQRCNNGSHGMTQYGETPKARIKSFLASKLVT